MVVTRSQADRVEQEERRREEAARAAGATIPNPDRPLLVHIEDPRSPSEQFVAPAAPPAVMSTERQDATPAAAPAATPAATPQRRVAFSKEQRAASPAASRCSSSTAARKRQAQKETEIAILKIKQKEAQLEKEMVQSKLALQLEQIEAEGSHRGSDVGEPEKQQYVDQWLATCVNAPPSALTESNPLSSANQGQPTHLNQSNLNLLSSANQGQPTYLNQSNPNLLSFANQGQPTYTIQPNLNPLGSANQGQPNHTIQPNLNQLSSAIQGQPTYLIQPNLNLLSSAIQGQPTHTIQPNPNPLSQPYLSQADYYEGTPRRESRSRDRLANAESRATSTSRAIELLAECIDKVSHNRPPPRQVYELPLFSGQPNEWLPFEAAYEQSTAAYRFTPSENVARLRSCLKGAAREVVAPLLYTATDPAHIMRTLKQCFGRPEIIVDRAIEDLKKLPRVGTSATDLNAFAVKVQNIVCVLKSVDKRGYLHNPLLTREILDRLSPHMRSRFCDFAVDFPEPAEPEIIVLSRFLMREADKALRFTYTTGGAATQAPPAPTRQAPPRPALARQAPKPAPRVWDAPKAVYATAAEEDRRCLCCGGNHNTPKCERVRQMDVAQRWDWAKSDKVCFKCLNSRHRRDECRAGACSVDGCPHSHHVLLHSSPAPKPRAPAPEPEEAPRTAPRTAPTRAQAPPRSAPARAPAPPRAAPTSAPAPARDAPPSAPAPAANEPEEHVVMATATTDRVCLKICPVTLRGPRGSVSTYALLDDGSTTTLLAEEVAREIGAVGPTVPLSVRGIGATNQHPSSQRVQVDVQGQGAAHTITARTVQNLELQEQTLDKKILQLEHLKNLGVAGYTAATPRLLIGADNWHVALVKDARVGRRTEPAAVRTELGWVIYGTIPRSLTRSNCGEVTLYVHAASRPEEARLDELMRSHFDIDALGVSLAVKERPADERARRIFTETIANVGNKSEVGLPWKHDDETMPASYGMALERLRGIERKMRRDPDFTREYSKQVNNLFEKDYAGPAEGAELSSPRAWVLPHFAVTNINKPGKIRLVFDAAAKSQGRCLNDFLLEGPDLLRSLPGILFRFREGRYAVTADIQEMFLRIKIRPEDQPAQMFLWREPGETEPPRLYKMTSLIFGASSSPFLAHSVRNHNAQQFAGEFPQALEPITKNHYMDDYVDSYKSEEEAIATAEAVTEVHRRGGFNLRSWSTNSERLRERLDPALRAEGPAQLGPTDTQKILGLCWSPEPDTLGFNTAMNRVAAEVRSRLRAPTKREALSAVMSIYDPLGLLSPYTVTAKLILQNLWRQEVSWDEPLPEEDERAFERWVRGLTSVAALRIPRGYDTGGGAGRRELHVFVDASEVAYATAAYFRTASPEVRVTLVAGKARVAPLKRLSIPRLELQAAVIGARLADTIRAEHRVKIDDVIYWSDSRTVLHWVRNDAKRYTPYVAHRLGEIAELTQPAQWRWVPTALNVADDATRAGGMNEPRTTDRWFVGPAFLLAGPDSWPVEEEESPDQRHEKEESPDQRHEKEESPDQRHEEEETCCAAREQRPWLPEVNRFSNYERLIRATARCLQFIDILRRRGAALEVKHLEEAEKLQIRRSQEESFGEEVRNLRAGKPIPRNSRLYELDPILEGNLLRVRGRINAAPVPEETKRPVILDGRHPLTRLLVLHEHCRAGHAANERVVNDLRQRYWVINLRPTVRAVARTCPLCVVRKAVPRPPAMGDLPLSRIEPRCRPFSNCGVDYFGPLTVTIGRRHEKRWVALFTCLTTRAVHLEAAASLTTDSAIMALRRMAARRGWPRTIWSDNGTNFRGADAELRAAYEEWKPALQEEALLHRAQWRFIPPGAPNQGGAWERLVRAVKLALTATLHGKAPKEEVLTTLLVEAEHTVNARPLTHVSIDPEDEEALTPNHFLLGSSTGLPTTGPCEEADRRNWRASQALADHFWTRWVREYLPTLVPRRSASGEQRPLQEGDLVVVVDGNLPRNVWPRGVVVKTYPGRDGGVRSADIRTKGGVFRRPTTRLAVIPVNEEAATAASASLRRGEC